MSNIELKKNIQQLTKRINDFKIQITLWHGDGRYHKDDIIYNEVSLFNKENEIIGDCSIYSTDNIIETDDNLKALRKEQKKLHNYLIKHFNNVEIKELNI